MLFLASQIMVWIVAGFLFGLAMGWWISGAMMLDLGSSKPSTMKKQSAQPGSVSVLSESLLKTQRELESCQQSLVQAEAKLKDLEIRFKPKDTPAADPFAESSNSSEQATDVAVDTRDDLTRIFGIGPFIENKLAEINITTYQQIANLTEEQILEVGDYLNYFPGRIQRDGWLESARELHFEKYGTYPV